MFFLQIMPYLQLFYNKNLMILRGFYKNEICRHGLQSEELIFFLIFVLLKTVSLFCHLWFKKKSDVRPGQACVWWTRPTETNVKHAGWRSVCKWAWTKMVNACNMIFEKENNKFIEPEISGRRWLVFLDWFLL